MDEAPATGLFRRLDELAAIGGDEATNGCHRLAWTSEDAAARRWFADEAASLGLDTERDRNGNLWAWWPPEAGAAGGVATGSHLDTVPEAGPYDGALGVAAGLTAVEILAHRGVRPTRPLAVVVFADSEGARFETPCLGSALLTGAVEAGDVVDRRDQAGVRCADALAAAGVDPGGLDAEPARLRQLDAFVELHLEHGRQLADAGAAVGVGSHIWPRGRWGLSVRGEANHAAAALHERHDPVPVLAAAVTAASERAAARGAVATVAKIAVTPNATTVVPAEVEAWLDARAPDGASLDRLLDEWAAAVGDAAAAHGCEHAITSASFSPAATFDEDLQRRLEAGPGTDGRVVRLASAGDHDAAVLADHVPSGMLFVRNPTGVSHSAAEQAGREDCLAGVTALADVLADLVA